MIIYILILKDLFGEQRSDYIINDMPMILKLLPSLYASFGNYVGKNIQVLLTYLLAPFFDDLPRFLFITIGSESCLKIFDIGGLTLKSRKITIIVFGWSL